MTKDPKPRNEFSDFSDNPDNDGFKRDEGRLVNMRDWGGFDDEQLEDDGSLDWEDDNIEEY